MHEQYYLPGTSNKDREQLNGREYNDPNFWPKFQDDWKRFLEIIKTNQNCVIMRIYDGELYFLQRKRIGNIPKRHCNQNLKHKDIEPFKQGVKDVDYLCIQLNENFMNKFKTMFSRQIDFPMEFCYAIVINKWIFKQYPKGEIALIGGSEKMKIIQELMKRKEYRDYLGIEYFADYISVPERYASNDPEKILEELEHQIQNSKAKIFLYGIGIAKMAIAPYFRFIKEGTYIDIGSGMSALAGFASIDRPYHGNWINHRIKDYDYNNTDKMDADSRNIKILD
jgi:hypothetical protein